MPHLRRHKIHSQILSAVASILLALWWLYGPMSTSAKDASADLPAAANLYSHASLSVFDLMATNFR